MKSRELQPNDFKEQQTTEFLLSDFKAIVIKKLEKVHSHYQNKADYLRAEQSGSKYFIKGDRWKNISTEFYSDVIKTIVSEMTSAADTTTALNGMMDYNIGDQLFVPFTTNPQKQ